MVYQVDWKIWMGREGNDDDDDDDDEDDEELTAPLVLPYATAIIISYRQWFNQTQWTWYNIMYKEMKTECGEFSTRLCFCLLTLVKWIEIRLFFVRVCDYQLPGRIFEAYTSEVMHLLAKNLLRLLLPLRYNGALAPSFLIIITSHDQRITLFPPNRILHPPPSFLRPSKPTIYLKIMCIATVLCKTPWTFVVFLTLRK